MGSSNELNIINVIEFWGNFWSEQPTSTSWRHCPCLNFLWVWPHEITEWSFMRNFHSSLNQSDLIDSLNIWGESSMDTEDLSFNNSTNTKVIKHFGAIFPWVGITILSNSFIIESVYCSNLSSFVVSSKESNVSWILEFQAEKELESLNWVVSSINKISHKDIAGVRDLTSLVEKF